MSNTSLFFVKVCQRNWKNMVDADIVISSAHLASQDLREFYISDLCYFKISNFCKIWGLMENPLSGSFNSQSKYFNFWARNVNWKYWFGFYHRQTSLFQNWILAAKSDRWRNLIWVQTVGTGWRSKNSRNSWDSGYAKSTNKCLMCFGSWQSCFFLFLTKEPWGDSYQETSRKWLLLQNSAKSIGYLF